MGFSFGGAGQLKEDCYYDPKLSSQPKIQPTGCISALLGEDCLGSSSKNIPSSNVIWNNFLVLNLKTNAVCMAMPTDKGVEFSLSREIIENISYQNCLRAQKGELTPIVFFASGVSKLYHFIRPF
jgi:hypothetical protein